MKWNISQHEDQGRQLSVLVTITLLIILAFLLGLCVWMYQYRNQFTSEKWQRNPARRAYIVADMLRDHPPVGLTEDEVRTLLGKPDMERDEENLLLGYVLGNARTVLDVEWLVLEFDDGSVIRYTIETGLTGETDLSG